MKRRNYKWLIPSIAAVLWFIILIAELYFSQTILTWLPEETRHALDFVWGFTSFFAFLLSTFALLGDKEK